MANKRIRSYWLVLLVMLMTANMVLSVEQTRAHYVNTVVWNTVVEAEEGVIASDCLVHVSDAPMTVLLGDMTTEKETASFTLMSAKDVTGSLTWNVDQGEYLGVAMRIGETALTKAGDVELTSGETQSITMTLSLKEKALTTVHDKMDIHVTVNWNDTLQGTFRVTIPEITEDELPTEPSEPAASEPVPAEGGENSEEPEEPVVEEEIVTAEETQPTEPPQEQTGDDTGESGGEKTGDSQTAALQETDRQNTERTLEEEDPASTESIPPETTAPSEPASTEITPPETTAPSEPAPTETAPPETTAPSEPASTETAPPETTAPSEPAPTETTPPETTAPSEPAPTETAPPETTAPSEPAPTETTPSETEPPAGDGEQQGQIETIGNFAASQKLPIMLTLPKGTAKVRLGMGVVSETGTEIQPFPERTCYSLDNGSSYCMLYHGGVLEIDPEGSTSVSVLMDLSRAGLADNTEVTLAAQTGTDHILVGSTKVSAAEEEAPLYRMDSLFLTRETPIEILLTENWKAYQFDYSVQLLTFNQGAAEYIDVDASAWSILVQDEENNKLTLRIDKELTSEQLPDAGTYRVRMHWSYGGICFAEEQTTFFINYSVYSESERTGGTGQ